MDKILCGVLLTFYYFMCVERTYICIQEWEIVTDVESHAMADSG
jgi:hypothetical protein